MSRHGSNACYAAGCRLPICRAAHRDEARRRRRGAPGLGSAAPYRELLREMTLPAENLSDISRATGIPVYTLREIRAGNVGMLKSRTQERLNEWARGLA